MPADTRLSPEAAEALRAAIRQAGGVEVFAIGRTDATGRVTDLEIHARGNEGAVPAFFSRPRPGEVVIHNHPSGVLQASEADMALAGRYGEDGVGVVIVNNAVTDALWVVEPLVRKTVLVDEAEVTAFFCEALPRAMPGYEARPGQVEMALHVVRALNHQEIAVLEAGTGTGKSLAYLVPAALWALKNQGRVAVATFTITLQGQLVTSDLPALLAGGLNVKYALLKGRTNYVCRRRLQEAHAAREARPREEAQVLDRLVHWAATSADGTRSDLPFPMDEDLWEQVQSDHDQTLRARCPHFGNCFYYQARRAAADSHVLVLNHALLLSDLIVKGDTGGQIGLLPKYDRLIVDEAHHLEDAATSLMEDRLSARAISRAIGPLLDRERRPGSLSRLRGLHLADDAPLPPEDRHRALQSLELLVRSLPNLRSSSRSSLEHVAEALLGPDNPTLRLTSEVEQREVWTDEAEPELATLARDLHSAAAELTVIEEALAELPEAYAARDPQPAFDAARCKRRLSEMASLADGVRHDTTGLVRWVELARERGSPPSAALCRAPIEVGPALKQRLFDALGSVVMTSATLTVGGQFEHLLGRLQLQGDERVESATFPSPFDYRRQALLGLPRDLPEPDAPDFEAAAADFIIRALRITGGGCFVLCTSFTTLRGLHRRVAEVLGDQLPLLRQGDLGRDYLLQRFRDSPSSVLFATDSFWEGVSVSGDALRLVIIPRLPFRVPTEPVSQARHERIQQLGQDPFRAYSLPAAVLRFRQGFGRLIRTGTDRGAVIVLDNRVASRWYGRIFLASLPDMERVPGPSRRVLERLSEFYRS